MKYKIGDTVYVNSTRGWVACEVREVPNQWVVKVRYPDVPELVTVAVSRLRK